MWSGGKIPSRRMERMRSEFLKMWDCFYEKVDVADNQIALAANEQDNELTGLVV
jgi:hypothetical protein